MRRAARGRGGTRSEVDDDEAADALDEDDSESDGGTRAVRCAPADSVRVLDLGARFRDVDEVVRVRVIVAEPNAMLGDAVGSVDHLQSMELHRGDGEGSRRGKQNWIDFTCNNSV